MGVCYIHMLDQWIWNYIKEWDHCFEQVTQDNDKYTKIPWISTRFTANWGHQTYANKYLKYYDLHSKPFAYFP